MSKLVALADRTAVLFLGVAAGAAIGFAFGRSGEKAPARPSVRAPRAAAAIAPLTPARGDPAAGPECALPFQQHLLETVAAGKPVTVGVFGDSFGDGVWSALYRLLPQHERFRVLKYSQQSTGFTRYSSLNLEEHAQAQLAADGPVDVAVISFGANDTQGVYSRGHAAALMSLEWQRVIGERVDRFVALMRGKGAMVYWVGLPKMRAPAFDDDIAAMNDFYTARMKALRVPFIDIKPLTVDEDGEFALYLADPVSHERRLLRANDGVHMSMNGYIVITRALADRIKAYVAAARVMAGVGEVAAATIPAKLALPPVSKADRPERDEQAERPTHATKRKHRERDDTPNDPARHRDEDSGSAAEAPARGKERERDKPERPREGQRDRAGPAEQRDGDTPERDPERKDRAARAAPDEKAGEPRSGEPRSGEPHSGDPHSGDPRPAAEEPRRQERRDRTVEAKPRASGARPKAEPARAGSAKSEQAKAEPAKSEQAKSEQAKSERAKSERAKSEPGKSATSRSKPSEDRSSGVKKKPGDGKAKSGDAPARPRKPREDDPAPPGQGNSQ